MIRINVVVIRHWIFLNHWIRSLWAEHLPYTRHRLSAIIRLNLYLCGELYSSGRKRQKQNSLVPGSSRWYEVHWRWSENTTPKICHFGVLIALSWRQLGKEGLRKALCPPPFYLKENHIFPVRKCLPCIRKREFLLLEMENWHQDESVQTLLK